MRVDWQLPRNNQCTIGGCIPDDFKGFAVNILEVILPRVDQLTAVVALDRQCLSEPWTVEGYARELDSPNGYIIALQRQSEAAPEQEIIGLACLWAIVEEAHITRLAIHPQYRQRGLGQALLLILLKIAQQQGLEWATLEVKASNQVAIALYEQLGFQLVGRRPNYYPDSKEDALILWLSGLQTAEFAQLHQQRWVALGDRLHQHPYQLLLSEEILNLTTLPLDADAVYRKNQWVRRKNLTKRE